MKPYVPAWYPSPISLPRKTIGKFSIKHRILTEPTPVVSMRQFVTRGVRASMAAVTKESPLRVHELTEGGGVWMTDLPEELNQIYEMLHYVNPKGRVLVGGLGLGILSRLLARTPGITHICTVEKEQAVIDLALPLDDKSVETRALRNYVCHNDISESIRLSRMPYDHYLLDTWAGTNEHTWWSTVLPLRRLIRQKFGAKPKIHCWAEDIMFGQVKRSLTRSPSEPHWFYVKEVLGMTDKQADMFLKKAGLPEWEQKFGTALDTVYQLTEK